MTAPRTLPEPVNARMLAALRGFVAGCRTFKGCNGFDLEAFAAHLGNEEAKAIAAIAEAEAQAKPDALRHSADLGEPSELPTMSELLCLMVSFPAVVVALERAGLAEPLRRIIGEPKPDAPSYDELLDNLARFCGGDLTTVTALTRDEAVGQLLFLRDQSRALLKRAGRCGNDGHGS